MSKLYLIPTVLAEETSAQVLPPQVPNVIALCNHFIVENERTARRFIKKICPEKSQPSLAFEVMDKHNPNSNSNFSFLSLVKQGIPVGILSEAGCPAIADPGTEVVALAHQMGIEVVPLVGPSSIIMVVMASGLSGQSFAFNGYLPIDAQQRKDKIKKLEQRARQEHQTQVFIETPYRNDKLLTDLKNYLSAGVRLCVACELTSPNEQILTQTIAQWKKDKTSFHKRPVIFALGF